MEVVIKTQTLCQLAMGMVKIKQLAMRIRINYTGTMVYIRN